MNKKNSEENIDKTKKLIEDNARRREQEEKKQKRKEMLEWIFLISVIFVTVAYYFWKTVQKSFLDLQYYTTLNQTTTQISQLVDNIRNVYKIHAKEKVSTMEGLIRIGAVPKVMMDDFGNIKNPFGGNIYIIASEPLENIKEAVKSPTFKMSYQGLSRRACVSLATMDWGDKMKGLVAVAIGAVDSDTDVDSALKDIDAKPEPAKVVTYTDKRGRKRVYRPRQEIEMNVAKPNDDFIPTPFPKDLALSGCSCGNHKNCSFALRYTVFGVDKPNRNDNTEEKSADK